MACLGASAGLRADEATSDQFRDSVEILKPERARSEQEERRLSSAAFYAHGRLLLDRRDLAGALRRYQRAWRYNSDASPILSEIVSVAFTLQRVEEAARYAAFIDKPEGSDALLLKRLALELSSRRQWQDAVRLYEQSEAAAGRSVLEAPADDVGSVLLCMEMGRLYFLVGKYDKSAELFARVREVIENPEQLSKNATLQKMVLGQPARTYQMLGESFLRAGDLDAAESMFRKHDEAEPSPAVLSFQLARIAAADGQHQAAIDLLEEYNQTESEDAGVEPYQLYAEQLRILATDPKAADQRADARLEKLLAASPQNKPLTYFMAARYLEAKRWERAQQLFENLATINPSAEAYEGLIRIQCHQRDADALVGTLGNACARAGSLEPFSAAIEGLVQDTELRDDVLRCVEERSGEAANHASGGELLAAAWLALKVERWDQANRFFQSAVPDLNEETKRDALLSWGVELLVSERYSTAADVFQKAIELPVDDPALFYFYRIRALALADEKDEALRLAEKASAKFPDVPRLAAQPAWVLYYAKRYDEAKKRMLALLDKYDRNHDSAMIRDQMRDTRLMLSSLCTVQHCNEEAQRWLEEVLDEFPEDVGALNDLGYLWTDQRKHLNWSHEMIATAVAAEPDNTAYVDSLGWSYYQLGRYKEAVNQLEKAVADDDPDGVILDHLGDAYAKAGRKQKALEAYRRARDAFEKAGEGQKRQDMDIKIQQYEK